LIEKSFLYRQKLLHIPIINKYAKFIASLFPERARLNLWPDNKQYAVVFTHDVDYPEIIRWVEVMRAAVSPNKETLRKIWEIIIGKINYWCFDQWMDIESAAGVRSAFYFSGFKGSLLRYLLKAPDTFYDIKNEKYRKLFLRLISNGFEIGLHASYNAYRSYKSFNGEKSTLESIIGQKVSSNRHHYWHADPEGFFLTIKLQHKIGLTCDTSLGLEQRSGFRYSIAAPFQIFDLDNQESIPIVELPAALMDYHLFGYGSKSYLGNSFREIDQLLEQVKTNNGVFVVNYHVRGFNQTMFPGWRKTYEYILGKVSADSDCWCALPSEVADSYLRRQLRLEENSMQISELGRK
jgi:hypothetical protein